MTGLKPYIELRVFDCELVFHPKALGFQQGLYCICKQAILHVYMQLNTYPIHSDLLTLLGGRVDHGAHLFVSITSLDSLKSWLWWYLLPRHLHIVGLSSLAFALASVDLTEDELASCGQFHPLSLVRGCEGGRAETATKQSWLWLVCPRSAQLL